MLFLSVLFLATFVAAKKYKYEVVAELSVVDYAWNYNHSRETYSVEGKYIPVNNAIAGVKVGFNGDIFVTVPRWMSGVPATLNQLVPNPIGAGFVLQPWPSWEFQEEGVSGDLQNCQSMIIDSQNRMWVIEVGRRNFFEPDESMLVNGAAGFYVIDVASKEVVMQYTFPNDVVSSNSSFLNDIVLDEDRGFAYFTDTWGDGAIVMYDMNSNTSRSFSGLSTMRDASYNFCVNGQCYGRNTITSPSDGIALSSSGDTLYWSPVQGTGLYSIATSYLRDFSLSDAELESHVVFLGNKLGCSDGMQVLGDSFIYGDVTHSSLVMIASIPSNEQFDPSADATVIATDTENLHWLDTFSTDPSDASVFYATSNKLDLWLFNNMDFTGQSGANFRVLRWYPVIADVAANIIS